MNGTGSITATAGAAAAEPAPTGEERRRGARADLLAGSVALLLLAPIFFRYRPPIQPGWDEAYFFGRAVCVDRAVAALDRRAFTGCFAVAKRSPGMALLALPWSGLAASPAGLGLTVFTLGVFQWVLAIAVVVLLLTLRVPRALVVLAAAAPSLTDAVRVHAGTMMADVPFAMSVTLTLLLVPLEARRGSPPTPRADVARGLLWGAAMSVGLLGKTTYLLFVAVVGPALLVARRQARGTRSALRTLAVAALASLPALVLVALSWKALWTHAKLAVTGSYAEKYSRWGGALEHAAGVVASAPALAAVVFLLALSFPLALRRRPRAALASLAPLLALALYGAATLASPNHDPRLVLPLLIAAPFALVSPWARLDGAAGPPSAARHAPAWLAAGILASAPLFLRYDFSNIADQVRLVRGLPLGREPVRVVLATDSPTLDMDSLQLALELVPERRRAVALDTVVYDDADGRELAFSLGKIEKADYVVLESDPARLWPDWTNRHVEAFREHVRAPRGHRVAELSTPTFEVHALPGTRR